MSKWTKEKIQKEILSYVLIFLGVFGFKSTFFEPNHIPSGSMLPTMAIGDFILVNKWTYGFKVPFSEWFTDPIYITDFKKPNRGDIVVFEYPVDRSILFVKRIVAMEGDEVEVINNRVYINGQEYKREPIQNGSDYSALYDRKPNIPMELEFSYATTGKTKHVVADNKVANHWPVMKPRLEKLAKKYELNYGNGKLIVPKGHFFVMGDNRDFSSDSRFWGPVPFTHLRGKALFVWFNMVYPWSKEKFHFRPGRIGTSFSSL